jgi:succinyl-CoA synthetase beta subunit
MSTLDLVTRAGGKPANFLDVGGGASAESVRQALEIVLMDPNVKGVLFNIFGGITRGDAVAQGILDAVATMDVRVPMVVRMAGTRAAEGLALLEGSPLTPAARPGEAAERIIELAKK